MSFTTNTTNRTNVDLETATAEDVFGPRDGDVTKAQAVYRRLARELHPDVGGSADAFVRLEELWRAWTGASPTSTWTLATKRRTYAVAAAPGRRSDELCAAYGVVWGEDGNEARGTLWLPRSPKDSDLVRQAASALKTLRTSERSAFFPELVETFRHRTREGAQRQALVVRDLPLGRWYSLAEVRAAYPDGLDPRDMAWMYRRLLAALSFAHAEGLVHGAVVPERVLIQPEEHGLVLDRWELSCPVGGRVPALASGRRAWYPPETLAGEAAGADVDLWLASRTAESLLPAGARPWRTFFRGVRLSQRSRRPTDAAAVLRDVDALLERLYGARRFRPFTMPDTSH